MGTSANTGTGVHYGPLPALRKAWSRSPYCGGCGKLSAMAETPRSDPILARFCIELDKLYGGRLERVILFGSRARGDAHQDSDYDIAIFLTDMTDRWREFHRLAEIETDILAETGAFINAMPFRAGAYRERTPLMHEIRREGIDL